MEMTCKNCNFYLKHEEKTDEELEKMDAEMLFNERMSMTVCGCRYSEMLCEFVDENYSCEFWQSMKH